MRSAGEILPVLETVIAPVDIIRYCAAADDYAPPHWDDRYMRAAGFDGIIVHGWMTMAHLCRAVAQWFPLESADIVDYSVRYHKTVYPGRVRYGGTIEAIDSGGMVALALWARDAAGDLTTSATMRVRPHPFT